MKLETVDIHAIHADPANVRRHPERNLAAIRASLARFGQQRPIVVDAKGVVRAGNGTLEAARALGWDKVKVVRTGLQGSEATAYSIADNRTGELAEWDDAALAEQLRALQSEDFDLSAVGYDAGEVDALIAGLADGIVAGEDPGPQIGRAAELQAKWGTAAGQLWVIPSKTTPGKEHRLLCGDSTKAEDVARAMAGEKAGLMATDPPYLVDYHGGNHPRSLSNSKLVKDKHHADYNEEIDPEFFVVFLRVALSEALIDNPAIYQWHAHKRQALVEQAWEDVGLLVHQQIIWVKSRAVLTYSHYMWAHEPCFYGWIRGKPPENKPEPGNTTVWQIDQKDLEGIHPTEKPLEIFTRPIQFHSRPGGICFEPFSGSGACLTASESTGRLCRAIEKAPAFVAVALERLAGMGLEPCLRSGLKQAN